MSFQNKRLLGIVIGVGLLLLIQFFAMRFGTGGSWSPFDFIVAGVVLLGTGLAIELALRIVKRTIYRMALCAAILLGLLVVWIELAVGLIGTRVAGS